MKERCYNPKANGYKYHGGKGIIICNEWLDNPASFYEWSLKNGYEKTLSIDRINIYGNYEPNNCRWITMLEQQFNKSNNIFIEIEGEIKTASQWSKEAKVCRETIIKRYNNGENKEDIFKDSSLKIEVEGEIKTLKQISKESGLSYDILRRRYNLGWELDSLFSESKKNKTKYIEINGEIHTATEWAKISGLTRNIILNRISYGWKNEDLLKPKAKRNNKKYINIDNEIHTINEWCNILGVSRMTLYRKLKNKEDELI